MSVRRRPHLGLIGEDRADTAARESWILPELALRHLAQWGASRPAKSQPTDELRRSILGVMTAVAESVQRIETQAGAPWERALAMDVAELSGLTGFTVGKVTTALAWLERTGILLAGDQGRWSTSSAVWGRAPMLGAIAWDVVRRRLREVQTPMAPALALLRTLALRVPQSDLWRQASEPQGDGTGGNSWCMLSSTDFIEATLFQRSAVLHGLAGLGRAGLVEQEARRGQCGRWRLTAHALGRVSEETPANPLDSQAILGPIERPSSPSELISLGGQGIPVRIAGLTLSLLPGMTVRVSVDSSGRRTYHVGEDEMVIGPIP